MKKNDDQFIIVKNNMIIQLMDRWLALHQKHIMVEEFFVKYHYKRIAIYGMGVLGRRLYEELKGSEIKVEYFIDKYIDKANDLGCRVYRDNEPLPKVDAVVNTVVLDWQPIVSSLSQLLQCEVIPIQDVLDAFEWK